MMYDLRCDGVRRGGRDRGGVCNYLLLRYRVGVDGMIETKCPRCNRLRTWQFTLVGAST